MRRAKRGRQYRGFGVSMTPELHSQLRALADEQGREVSAVIRSIVVPYLTRRARRLAKQAEAAA